MAFEFIKRLLKFDSSTSLVRPHFSRPKKTEKERTDADREFNEDRDYEFEFRPTRWPGQINIDE